MNIADFQIDQHSKDPLHLQIAEQVRNLIAMEKLKPGDHLPPVRKLAEFLNINQNTILRAYLLLEQEKVVVTRKRGGTVVTAQRGQKSLAERGDIHGGRRSSRKLSIYWVDVGDQGEV